MDESWFASLVKRRITFLLGWVGDSQDYSASLQLVVWIGGGPCWFPISPKSHGFKSKSERRIQITKYGFPEFLRQFAVHFITGPENPPCIVSAGGFCWNNQLILRMLSSRAMGNHMSILSNPEADLCRWEGYATLNGDC